MKLLIVSGLSGSGKSVALHMLEDLGYHCMDNLPLGLLEAFVRETSITGDKAYARVAVGVDARAGGTDIARFADCLDRLRDAGVDVHTLYLQAEHDVILKRYSETRRRHPLSSDSTPLAEAVDRERELLAPIAEYADTAIDTSRTSVQQLREMISAQLQDSERQVSVLLQSFGFKHGLPAGADYVFDVRCLPNPYWQQGLRALTGRDEAVQRYLESHEVVEQMYLDLRDFLERWLDHFQQSNRSYVTIAIGCTGGQHRSVYMAERLGNHLRRRRDRRILIRHSELS